MDKPPISRGFRSSQREQTPKDRLPPGQYVTQEFPVLSAGPTPQIKAANWNFALQFGGSVLGKWNWEEFEALPQTTIKTDIHCATKWSKLDTTWQGVMFDDLLTAVGLSKSRAAYIMAHCDGGYTTNVPVADLVNGREARKTPSRSRRAQKERGPFSALFLYLLSLLSTHVAGFISLRNANCRQCYRHGNPEPLHAIAVSPRFRDQMVGARRLGPLPLQRILAAAVRPFAATRGRRSVGHARVSLAASPMRLNDRAAIDRPNSQAARLGGVERFKLRPHRPRRAERYVACATEKSPAPAPERPLRSARS